MFRRAPIAAFLSVLALAACGDDEETTTNAATTTEAAGAAGASGADGPPVEIGDVQACLEDGHDVQRNTGTVGESTGDLVVDFGVSGVVYVFEDAEAAASGEADVREYEDASPYRDYEIEILSNTVIGYETEPSAERLRACISG